jgi:6-phospho-beta-glucosidase
MAAIRISKLAILGGSSSNTVDLFPALAKARIQIDEISLIGRSREKVELIASFSKRLCQELPYSTKITTHTDIRAGMEGADFILNHIRVGGDALAARAGTVIKKHGLQGQARNFVQALSNLRVMHELAEEALKTAPKAWFIQFANPSGLITESIMRSLPGLKVISGCPAPGRARISFANLLNVPLKDPFNPSGLEIHWIGFNHCAWIADITHEGRSLMREAMEKNEALEKPIAPVTLARQTGCFWMMEAGKLLSHPQVPIADPEMPAGPSNLSSPASESREEALFKSYADSTLSPGAVMKTRKQVDWYDGCVTGILRGLRGPTPVRYFCKVPSNLSLHQFPGTSVECPVTLSASEGIQPLKTASLPRGVLAMAGLLRVCEGLLIEGTLERRRSKLVECFALHPSSPGPTIAEDLVDELNKALDLQLK